MKSVKIINNIFRFYPLGLLLLFIIQVLLVVLSLGGNFPKAYITTVNPIIYIFVFIFMILSLIGFIIFFMYPAAKIIDMIKNKENTKKNSIDIVIFMIGFIAFCSFGSILNDITHYIDWIID